ncbi:MAG: SRPBCC family protein [Cytophagales bacterium]|nr:MAG: SRPBCC family protein [Cytophagales bacterium]
MKKSFITFFVVMMWLGIALAQNEPYKKAKSINKIEIGGNIDFAWTFLSNLSNLEKLVPSTIEKSILTGNGKGGIVTLKLTNNKGSIIEKVVYLDNKKRKISYTMISTPLPIKNYLATFKVNKISEQKFEVVFTASFEVQDKNREVRINAFNTLQLELLQNIKKITNENK